MAGGINRKFNLHPALDTLTQRARGINGCNQRYRQKTFDLNARDGQG